MNIPTGVERVDRTSWSSAGQRTGIKSFNAFDGLRGYMAWWVVIGHALHLCGLQNAAPNILTRGDHAVNVFVCLSGFVICHMLLERQESYGAYLTRRAFRIFPIYWFALACALVLTQAYGFVYAGDWVFEGEMRVARAMATEANFGKHLLLHIGLLQGMVPDTWLPFSSTAFLAPAWSLSLEWQFYLVAPFIVAGLARPGLSRLLMLLLLSASWLVFKRVLPLQWQYPAALPLSIHFFMLGILSRVFLPAIARAGSWLLPVGLIAVVVAPNSVRTELALWSVFLTAACSQLRTARGRATTAHSLDGILRSVTSNPVARRLGEFSYSTYLMHIPLFVLVGWTMAQLSDAWTQNVAIGSTAIAIILLVPLSAVLYRFIEQPCIRWGVGFARHRAPLLTPG
jgi:peptidoglycan/LPS O-acetylase OafA/YrhL